MWLSSSFRNTAFGWWGRIIENSKIMTSFVDSAGDFAGGASALLLTSLQRRNYPSPNISEFWQGRWYLVSSHIRKFSMTSPRWCIFFYILVLLLSIKITPYLPEDTNRFLVITSNNWPILICSFLHAVVEELHLIN